MSGEDGAAFVTVIRSDIVDAAVEMLEASVVRSGSSSHNAAKEWPTILRTGTFVLPTYADRQDALWGSHDSTREHVTIT